MFPERFGYTDTGYGEARGEVSHVIGLLILVVAGLLIVTVYACLVMAGEADRREEAMWARWEKKRRERD